MLGALTFLSDRHPSLQWKIPETQCRVNMESMHKRQHGLLLTANDVCDDYLFNVIWFHRKHMILAITLFLHTM